MAIQQYSPPQNVGGANMIIETQPGSASTDAVLRQPGWEPDVPSTAGLPCRWLGGRSRLRNRFTGCCRAGTDGVVLWFYECWLQPVYANRVLFTSLKQGEIFFCSSDDRKGSEVRRLERLADRVISDQDVGTSLQSWM